MEGVGDRTVVYGGLLGQKKGFLGFRHLYESLLNKLRRSRHSIGVDRDAGKQVRIAIVMSLRRRAAQLNLDTSLYQIKNELLVWIAGRYVSIGVVSLVVQCYVARICVEDCEHVGSYVPVSAIVHDELEVKEGGRQIPFERE